MNCVGPVFFKYKQHTIIFPLGDMVILHSKRVLASPCSSYAASLLTKTGTNKPVQVAALLLQLLR